MKKNNYNLLVILLSVLFTAIITGLGTYYWQQNVQKKIVLSKTDKQIEQKIKKINIPLNIRDIEVSPLVINNKFIGYVRVILLENGYEHITTPLTIQWLDETSSKIIHEVSLNNIAGPWSLGIDSIKKNSKGLLLKLSGDNAYIIEEKNKTFEIQISDKKFTGNLK